MINHLDKFPHHFAFRAVDMLKLFDSRLVLQHTLGLGHTAGIPSRPIALSASIAVCQFLILSFYFNWHCITMLQMSYWAGLCWTGPLPWLMPFLPSRLNLNFLHVNVELILYFIIERHVMRQINLQLVRMHALVASNSLLLSYTERLNKNW